MLRHIWTKKAPVQAVARRQTRLSLHGKIEYEQQALPLYYAWPACQHKTMLPACCAYYVYKKNN
jgi:hypothetical protein